MAYHKINTIFKRGKDHKLIHGDFSQEEFRLLATCQWDWTEKVDGTNIRITRFGHGATAPLIFRGRKDTSTIPLPLLKKLHTIFDLLQDVGILKYNDLLETEVVLHGEGFGNKIQKVGYKYIPDDISFVLFDVQVDGLWLKREDVEDVAKVLGIQCVPLIDKGNLWNAIKFVTDGFKSQWGDFPAEGIVARPSVELLDRRGRRIITKIKTVDFKEK